MKSFNSKTDSSKGKAAQSQADSFFQAKLNMGQAGDKYELEADQMADHVVEGINDPSANHGADTAVQTQQEEEVQTKETAEAEVQEKPLAETVTPVVQAQVEEEQVQEKEEEEELQKQEEEEIQKSPEASDEGEDDNSEGNVQAKSDQSNTVSPGLESQIKSSTGGSPMDAHTQSNMESGFGADFSDVKVHTDSTAVQMSRDLGAQAFTHGNDIYFNEGKYDPGSTSGQHLLAHELTHTIQQGSSSSVQGKMVQKDGEEESSFSPDTFTINDVRGLNLEVIISNSDTIVIDKFPMGAYKVPIHNRQRPFSRPKNYRRESNEENNSQRSLWTNNLKSSSAIVDFVESNVRTQFREDIRDSKIYIFKVPGGQGNQYRRIIGQPEAIKEELTLPSWRSNGSRRWFQIDHKQELQLGGQNEVNNLNLLNEDSNRAYGFSINNTISMIAGKIGDHEKENPSGPRSNLKNATVVKQHWNLRFNNAVNDPTSRADANPSHWDYDQIYSGEHLQSTNDISLESIDSLGDESKVFIFPFTNGGVGKQFNNNTSLIQNEKLWLNPWVITSKTFNTTQGSENTDTLGDFHLELKENEVANAVDSTPLTINRYRGSRFAGYLDVNKFFLQQYSNRAFNIKKFSPVTFTGANFYGNNGPEITGKVHPTLSLIEGTDLDLSIRAGDIEISKTFDIGSFNFPRPFEISDSSLSLFVSTERGLGIEGQVNFGIDQVGEGHIGAAASTSGGFELEGAFNFDSELFDPAEINVEYKDNIWTIGGEIGIPEGKVRGVKSATITASYSENNFTATGEAELDIPGIERGSMTVEYGEEGFSIGGNFDLSSDIPGITGGNVEARVSKESGAEEYDIFVTGTAQPDIPGITTSLSVTYENGALTIEGSASYSRGMLSGTVNVGATNRAIGDDGEPTGEPDDTMRVYGGGSLTLQLTPWLAATAGVNFTPEGEIEVTARLSSDSYEVFRRREINRNLFSVPTIEIPLFAIPLGPRSIGLVAQIGGGLDFTAGFGPGELRNLSAEITYNPEREEETTVAGHGEFAIPADAGLTLRGDLSLGVSVAIASLSGGIELAGTLGLEGEAAAEVDVNWSPQTGLALDAEGRITVNPKFTFDINAFARASLGIGWFSISETWRHNLASYEWGPGIQFGVVFPVHYREGEPFDMSFDDIEVIYPDLDVIDMAKGLARDVKNDLFD
ncbi:eCIS core domain-containing protein [Echinicola salinicaeni]|uniref:eCIS core domain-containing protein n=1 Tax=Echinicola salinicaeni TaxID=2762757 RepID=UPI001644256C|nr:DUF4157 domain-containing protein [Echinicola salinicaeni]